MLGGGSRGARGASTGDRVAIGSLRPNQIVDSMSPTAVGGAISNDLPTAASNVKDDLSNKLAELVKNDNAATTVAADRAWSEAQAQKQMDFQKMMSDTAYQRAVKDLKAAGLNPALAYSQGGASSSAGAMAYSQSTQQAADITREDNVFKLVNSLISALGGLANTALNRYLPSKSISFVGTKKL